jgi:nitrate/TMAO reductase-like tetraheme cytochrome c subunit
MMELTKEQIVKATETLEGAKVMVANRDFDEFQNAIITAINALTIIKEHTEKTEEYCRECAELRVVLYEITDEVNQIKADVVRKMQELTKVNLDKYGNKLDGYSIVDQTAKEMLED